MSGMPLFHVLLLVASVAVLIIATQRHLHPFIAIVAVASGFGLAAGLSISLLGKAFGNGFSQAVYSPGFVIIAAGFVAGIAEHTGAAERLMAVVARWRLGSTRLAAACGLIAGIAASPASAFALVRPLLGPIADTSGGKRETTTLALALALSASHGLVLFSPVLIAAASILGAAWSRVALFGLPVAVSLAAFAAGLARWLPIAGGTAQLGTTESFPISQKQAGGSATALVLAAAIPLLLLMVQSLGDIPSEPLGGGTAREFVLGVGRPLILFVVGIGIMVAGHWRSSVKLFADATWSGRVLSNVAGIVLTVAAAGGLQKLCQETGMAELIGERLLGFNAGAFGGLLIPFLIAATIKTLQGSSLVAAITTAGMVQPLLAPLGIGDESGKALASLAIGAGAMTITHINDEYFWLVTGSAGLAPLRGLTTLTIGTLLQGIVAAAALLIIFVLVSAI
jgi:GntP family gluconate:H+ symporter